MKLTKHDRHVEELYCGLKDKYEYLAMNIPLTNSKRRKIGEIDLLGVHGDWIDIYEVKTSYRIHKAKKQLFKLKKNLGEGNYRFYFYCGSSKQLVQMET